MLTTKKMTLKPLIESVDGVHLTVYLENRGRLTDKKNQLREAINQAYEWLTPVMEIEERNKFLEPLDALLLDTRIFKQMKGNIGIFRNHDSFRMLNIPVHVEQTCQVATSFHVKPLLRWLQMDQEFLLLGLENESAHLYLGSQDSLKLVDSIVFPESLKNTNSDDNYRSLKEAKKRKLNEDETFVWLNDWIFQLTKTFKPKLFIAGERSLVDALNRSLRYANAVQNPAANFFCKERAIETCFVIRKILKAESRAYIEKALMEFRFAEASNRASKNLFQISKSVVLGRVRKLIVSDELNIFGKIDKSSGGLAIHPFDLDHEDDDILDDLAQMVLIQGGEVIVASRSEIPKGHPILAILGDEESEMERSAGFPHFEALHGRFA